MITQLLKEWFLAEILLSNQIFKILWVFEQTGVGKMFQKRLEIGKERMLDGLFQKVSWVDLL